MNTSIFVYLSMIPSLLCLSEAQECPQVTSQHATHSGQDVPELVLSRTLIVGELRVHHVASDLQKDETQIHVLLPDQLEEDERLPVIYLLPVEADISRQWGDPLEEIARFQLQNTFRAVYVYPTFSDLPWYCDHPENSQVKQESYFILQVIPFIEKTYPVSRDRSHRLLVGFSKSGWGSWGLLLRHPDVVGCAVAWDAPLMLRESGHYGSGPIFGSQQNFKKYRISDLVEEKAHLFQSHKRLILLGIGNFEEHHVAMHRILEEKHVLHVYRDGPRREHHWNSGWLADAIRFVMTCSLHKDPMCVVE